MEKFIRIDGREVPFRATAAVPRIYRIKFGRDIMQDMRDLQAAIEKSESGEQPIPVKLLEVFENAAYLMARHADPDMKEHSVEEWLDTFGTFSIYEVFPQLLELWQLNNLSIGESKKNEPSRPGNDHGPVLAASGTIGYTNPGSRTADHRHGDRHADRGGERRLRV